MNTIEDAAKTLRRSIISLSIYGYSEDKEIQKRITKIGESMNEVADFLESYGKGEDKTWNITSDGGGMAIGELHGDMIIERTGNKAADALTAMIKLAEVDRAERKQPMNNQQWLATLPANEWFMKVHWLWFIYGRRYTDSRMAVLDWLQEEHRPDGT